MTPHPDMTFKNGSKIIFRALTKLNEEDTSKFKNMNLGFFAMDQAESIEEEVWEMLGARLPAGIRVQSVTTWESPRCGVTYRG